MLCFQRTSVFTLTSYNATFEEQTIKVNMETFIFEDVCRAEFWFWSDPPARCFSWRLDGRLKTSTLEKKQNKMWKLNFSRWCSRLCVCLQKTDSDKRARTRRLCNIYIFKTLCRSEELLIQMCSHDPRHVSDTNSFPLRIWVFLCLCFRGKLRAVGSQRWRLTLEKYMDDV